MAATSQQQQQQRQIAQQMAQQQQAISQLQQQLQADVNKPVQEQIARQQARLDDLQQESESYILLDKRQRQALPESSLAYPDAIELVSLISELLNRLTANRKTSAVYISIKLMRVIVEITPTCGCFLSNCGSNTLM